VNEVEHHEEDMNDLVCMPKPPGTIVESSDDDHSDDDDDGGGTPESLSPPDEPPSAVETRSCLANPALATPPSMGVALPVREPVAPEATPPVPALLGPTVPTPAKTLRYERSVAGQTVGLEPKDVIQAGDKMLVVHAWNPARARRRKRTRGGATRPTHAGSAKRRHKGARGGATHIASSTPAAAAPLTAFLPYVPSWPAPEPMMMIPFYRPGYGGSFAPPAWPPPTCTMPSRPAAAANDVSGTPSSVEAARHAEPPATWWTGADALSGKVYYYNTMTGAASPTWPPQI